MSVCTKQTNNNNNKNPNKRQVIPTPYPKKAANQLKRKVSSPAWVVKGQGGEKYIALIPDAYMTSTLSSSKQMTHGTLSLLPQHDYLSSSTSHPSTKGKLYKKTKHN